MLRIRSMATHIIPWHVAATELRGNNVSIPRDTQLAACFPLGDTVYYLPKLLLEPDPYMSGRVLMLRTYTAFEIIVTAAAGDTIMGSASMVMAGGNLVILVYISGNEWQVMANIPGGGIPTPSLIVKESEPAPVVVAAAKPIVVDPRPMTPLRTLKKR